MSSSVVCVCHAAQSTLQCVVCDRAGVTCVRPAVCVCGVLSVLGPFLAFWFLFAIDAV